MDKKQVILYANNLLLSSQDWILAFFSYARAQRMLFATSKSVWVGGWVGGGGGGEKKKKKR